MWDSIAVSTFVRNYNKKVGDHFFSKDSMDFFGDSFENFYITDGGDHWKLKRRLPVKNGVQSYYCFDKKTFKRLPRLEREYCE